MYTGLAHIYLMSVVHLSLSCKQLQNSRLTILEKFTNMTSFSCHHLPPYDYYHFKSNNTWSNCAESNIYERVSEHVIAWGNR